MIGLNSLVSNSSECGGFEVTRQFFRASLPAGGFLGAINAAKTGSHFQSSKVQYVAGVFFSFVIPASISIPVFTFVGLIVDVYSTSKCKLQKYLELIEN